MTERKYGYIKDSHDPRDFTHTFSVAPNQSIIKSVDLREYCPPICNQGNINSCTACSIAAAFQYSAIKQNEPHIFTPSRLFIYYNERKMEGTINEDCGAMIRDGMKSVASYGVCPETMWQYARARLKMEPNKESFEKASHHKVIKYKRVTQTLAQLKQCLIEGFPIIFGMQIYAKFESPEVAKSGIVCMPEPNEVRIGGHAMLCVGFDDYKKVFIIRNSWGTGWGIKGYCYVPYDYLTNPELATDFWTLRKVRDTEPIIINGRVIETPEENDIVEDDCDPEETNDETDTKQMETNNKSRAELSQGIVNNVNDNTQPGPNISNIIVHQTHDTDEQLQSIIEIQNISDNTKICVKVYK